MAGGLNLFQRLSRVLSGLVLLLALGLFFLFSPIPYPVGSMEGKYGALAAEHDIHPGYRSIVTRLPGSRIRLELSLWYPTQRTPSRVRAGDWTFYAANRAVPLPGPWPLVILSHDSSGTRYSHHDLAAGLARRGFVVAAPTHDGDNLADMRLFFSERQLPARALQLSAAVDTVLADPNLGSVIDRQRIGLIAFGRTSTTGLLLAGGRLTPDLWPSFCRQNPSSPYCKPYIAEKMDKLTQDMRQRRIKTEEAVLMREQAEVSRSAALKKQKEGVLRAYGRVQRKQRRGVVNFPRPPFFLPLLPPLPPEENLADPRFKALALISPGFSALMDPDSLAGLKTPVLLMGLGQDPLDIPSQQALALSRMLTAQEARYKELPDASLADLQAVCPQSMARDYPGLCHSAGEEDHEALHRQLEDELSVFFRSMR